jgi:hypothetical protein
LGFGAKWEGCSFYNVLNPGDDECHLTVSMRGYTLKVLLLKQPRVWFDRYSALLTEALREIPEVSQIKWKEYRR